MKRLLCCETAVQQSKFFQQQAIINIFLVLCSNWDDVKYARRQSDLYLHADKKHLESLSFPEIETVNIFSVDFYLI